MPGITIAGGHCVSCDMGRDIGQVGHGGDHDDGILCGAHINGMSRERAGSV